MYSLLIIEDSENIRRNLVRLIKNIASFTQISEATNLADARTILSLSEPDAVILDIDLPDGTGLELLREIKSNNKSKIVVFTNYFNEHYYRQAMTLGADHFLDKVKDINKLISVFSEYALENN